MQKIPETDISYKLSIDIPFNRETSRHWSPNKDLNVSFIYDTFRRAESIITTNERISLGRIFRMLGIPEQPEHPTVYFQGLDEDSIELSEEDGTIYITMDLYGWFIQNPVKRKGKKAFKPYLVNPEQESRRLAEDAEPVIHMDGNDTDGDEVIFKEAAECQTGQKETSDSEENGKT